MNPQRARPSELGLADGNGGAPAPGGPIRQVNWAATAAPNAPTAAAPPHIPPPLGYIRSTVRSGAAEAPAGSATMSTTLHNATAVALPTNRPASAAHCTLSPSPPLPQLNPPAPPQPPAPPFSSAAPERLHRSGSGGFGPRPGQLWTGADAVYGLGLGRGPPEPRPGGTRRTSSGTAATASPTAATVTYSDDFGGGSCGISSSGGGGSVGGGRLDGGRGSIPGGGSIGRNGVSTGVQAASGGGGGSGAAAGGAAAAAATGGHAAAAAGQGENTAAAAGAAGTAAAARPAPTPVIGGPELVLQVFKGLMRPDVAPLAVSAAQRALVTSPDVPPGLYLSAPQRVVAVEVPVAAAAAAGGRGGRGRGGGGRRTGGGAGVGAGGMGREVLRALPLGGLYPWADAEAFKALQGLDPLPQPERLEVRPINDRCHPCYRNPFEELAAQRHRKLVARRELPEGCLLGLYLGEMRSGSLDERVVGHDMSGREGLKHGYTFTVLDGLDVHPLPGAAVPPGATAAAAAGDVGGREQPRQDVLVVVGDPGVCPLAEINVTHFWGPCSQTQAQGHAPNGGSERDVGGGGSGAGNSGSGGGGGGSSGRGPERSSRAAACNCDAYRHRVDNAARISCVLKVPLSLLRAAAEAVGDTEVLTRGLPVLKAAAAMAAGGGSSSGCGEEQEAEMFVYGAVVVMITKSAIKADEEILLPGEGVNFFEVADQNIRQYNHIQQLESARDAALERSAVQLKTAQEAREALDVAVQEKNEAVRQKNEAVQQKNAALQENDLAVAERDAARQGMELAEQKAAEEVRASKMASDMCRKAANEAISKAEQKAERLQRENAALKAESARLKERVENLLEQQREEQRRQEKQQQQQEEQEQQRRRQEEEEQRRGQEKQQQQQEEQEQQRRRQEEEEQRRGQAEQELAAECERLRAQCKELTAQRDEAVRKNEEAAAAAAAAAEKCTAKHGTCASAGEAAKGEEGALPVGVAEAAAGGTIGAQQQAEEDKEERCRLHGRKQPATEWLEEEEGPRQPKRQRRGGALGVGSGGCGSDSGDDGGGSSGAVEAAGDAAVHAPTASLDAAAAANSDAAATAAAATAGAAPTAVAPPPPPPACTGTVHNGGQDTGAAGRSNSNPVANPGGASARRLPLIRRNPMGIAARSALVINTDGIDAEAVARAQQTLHQSRADDAGGGGGRSVPDAAAGPSSRAAPAGTISVSTLLFRFRNSQREVEETVTVLAAALEDSERRCRRREVQLAAARQREAELVDALADNETVLKERDEAVVEFAREWGAKVKLREQELAQTRLRIDQLTQQLAAASGTSSGDAGPNTHSSPDASPESTNPGPSPRPKPGQGQGSS